MHHRESRACRTCTDPLVWLYSKNKSSGNKRWVKNESYTWVWNMNCLLCSISLIVRCRYRRWIIYKQIINEQPYLCSHCLNVFKVASILLKCDGSLVEEPLECHIQGCVMRGLTAQHHALSHGHLHPVRAELHTHGICKHNAAALSPQANPDLLRWCSNWLWATWKSKKETQTEIKRTFSTSYKNPSGD